MVFNPQTQLPHYPNIQPKPSQLPSRAYAVSDGWISFGTLHERQRDRFEAQLGKDDVARIDYLRYAVPTAGFRQRDQAANWGRIVLNLAVG